MKVKYSKEVVKMIEVAKRTKKYQINLAKVRKSKNNKDDNRRV